MSSSMPYRSGIRPPLFVLVLATLTSAPGCVLHHPHDVASQSVPVDRDLAVPALTTPATDSPAATNTRQASSTAVRQPSNPTTGHDTVGGQTHSWRVVQTVLDATGDAGLQAPAYADMTAVTLEDDGVSARLTVTVAGSLPSRVASDEVMGIGVDIYKADTAEGDYDLFADGEPDGWFGYLQVGQTTVRYPGTLAVGGAKVAFVVPWSALGSMRAGRISAFVDWSKKSTLISRSSSDRAPDARSIAWSR
jgi:hypothetical protein